MLGFDLLLNVPISCVGTSNDESTKIKICMKQNRKRWEKNPNHDENCKIAGERMKTSKEEGGGKKTFSKWNADCEVSTSTRCAIMSTNSANWMKWNTYISFDYLRIVHSWNMVDERWKIIHANQFPFEVFKRGMRVDVLIFNAGVLHVFIVFSLIIIPKPRLYAFTPLQLLMLLYGWLCIVCVSLTSFVCCMVGLCFTKKWTKQNRTKKNTRK